MLTVVGEPLRGRKTTVTGTRSVPNSLRALRALLVGLIVTVVVLALDAMAEPTPKVILRARPILRLRDPAAALRIDAVARALIDPAAGASSVSTI